MRVLIAIIVAGFFVAVPANAQPVKEHNQMLYTVAQVTIGSNLGSGTVIFSAEIEGKWKSYVLTNRHVVSGAITVTEEWDSRQDKDVKRERRRPVKLEWFEYNNYSRAVGTFGREGVIVAHDEAADLALVKVTDEERPIAFVAALLPEGSDLYLAEPVWAVGSGLGKPPFISDGLLSLLDERIKGYRYILSTAPIIFGNSGGGLFHWSEALEKYELIGVPSKVSGVGFSIVAHMVWSIPIETVREFMRDNCYGFILGDKVEDAEKCDGPGEITKPDVTDR